MIGIKKAALDSNGHYNHDAKDTNFGRINQFSNSQGFLINKYEVSYFPSLSASGKTLPMDIVFERIKGGHCKKTVEALRRAKKNGDVAAASRLKTSLPSFTPSGIFRKSHSKADLLKYNSLVVLDIDKLSVEGTINLKQKAIQLKYTFAAFISPSGEGLKLIVRTASTVDSHESTYNQVVSFYEKELLVNIDISGKDYSRLCFLSYDPDLFINEDAEVFTLQDELNDYKADVSKDSVDLSELFSHVVTFTNRMLPYQQGNRNNFIYLLANNLNRIGMEKNEAEYLIKEKYTDPDMSKEIPACIHSAYSHTSDHGIWSPSYVISVSSVSSVTAVNTHLCAEPFIPIEVYSKLPELLRRCSDIFEVHREKDVFLTGALTILSGCFRNVKGIYDRREFSCNIFSFVIAPPASGKGVLIYAKALGSNIHQRLMEDYIDLANDYFTPLQRCFYIPADSSAAAVKGNLRLNNGMGTICETEADTLSSTFQQEWGQYSDLMRRAFQHEPITYSRLDNKGKPAIEEILHPELSLCISGTPNQLPALIKGIEDGMLSRILFYKYKNDGTPSFKNVFLESNVVNLNEFFDNVARELYNNYFLKCRESGSIIFAFSQEQQLVFMERFDKMVKYTHLMFGNETVPIVYRLGLITFRIAMVLTILRKIEKNELTETIECEDADFFISLNLSDVYLEHALSVYQLIPGNRNANSVELTLLSFLPESFSYKEAVKIGEVTLNISEKTVYNHLRKLIDTGYVTQPKKNGPYYKRGLQ